MARRIVFSTPHSDDHAAGCDESMMWSPLQSSAGLIVCECGVRGTFLRIYDDSEKARVTVRHTFTLEDEIEYTGNEVPFFGRMVKEVFTHKQSRLIIHEYIPGAGLTHCSERVGRNADIDWD